MNRHEAVPRGQKNFPCAPRSVRMRQINTNASLSLSLSAFFPNSTDENNSLRLIIAHTWTSIVLEAVVTVAAKFCPRRRGARPCCCCC